MLNLGLIKLLIAGFKRLAARTLQIQFCPFNVGSLDFITVMKIIEK